jgi:hypothetical protein
MRGPPGNARDSLGVFGPRERGAQKEPRLPEGARALFFAIGGRGCGVSARKLDPAGEIPGVIVYSQFAGGEKLGIGGKGMRLGRLVVGWVSGFWSFLGFHGFTANRGKARRAVDGWG